MSLVLESFLIRPKYIFGVLIAKMQFKKTNNLPSIAVFINLVIDIKSRREI